MTRNQRIVHFLQKSLEIFLRTSAAPFTPVIGDIFVKRRKVVNFGVYFPGP